MAKEALNAVLDAEKEARRIIDDAKSKASSMTEDAQKAALLNKQEALKKAESSMEERTGRVKKECDDFIMESACVGQTEASSYEARIMENADKAAERIISRLF